MPRCSNSSAILRVSIIEARIGPEPSLTRFHDDAIAYPEANRLFE